MTAFAPASLQQALAAYEQAVALDSTFAEAWARIGQVQTTLYYNSEPTPAKAEAARHAAERALALAPNRPEGHQAMALYHYNILTDVPRALTEDSIALTLAPGNSEVLIALGYDELALGKADAARGHLERAARLDPRSGATAGNLGFVLLCTGRYPEAERAYDRALELSPENLQWRQFRAIVSLAQGDLLGARAVLRAAPKEVDPTSLVAYMAQYADLIWVLEPAQQALLLRLTPRAFDGNRGIWGWVRSQAYALQRDTARSRAYADTARAVLQSQVEAAPDNAELHIRIGLAAAFQGDKVAAIREGLRGVALLPMKRHAVDGAYLQHQLVRIYIAVGEFDEALENLEPLLRAPYILSPDFLRIDPTFEPLRGNPRFERLVSGEPRPTAAR
jgi:tetratricopeptide (TPR) repeat protein